MFSKEIQFLKKLQEQAASGYVFFFQRRKFRSLEFRRLFRSLKFVVFVCYVAFMDIITVFVIEKILIL